MDANLGSIRAIEELNGVWVGWLGGIGEGMEERVRELILRYAWCPELAADGLVLVGLSPWPQGQVFQPRMVYDGHDSYRWLTIGEMWWSASAEQAEYDYVMASLCGRFIEEGTLVMDERGLRLLGFEEAGLDPADTVEFLNWLSLGVIDYSRTLS